MWTTGLGDLHRDESCEPSCQDDNSESSCKDNSESSNKDNSESSNKDNSSGPSSKCLSSIDSVVSSHSDDGDSSFEGGLSTKAA